MIVSLRGTVIDKDIDRAVIECSGVGYEVFCTPNTLAQLGREESVFLYIEHVVREAAETLYGFLNKEDRHMFQILQTVSGLGPRTASAALAVFSGAELAQAIQEADIRRLQKIPGVGKKSAERMALELKEKTTGIAEVQNQSAPTAAPDLLATAAAVQVTEALIGLGFNEKQATSALANVASEAPQADASQLLSLALKQLARK